MAQRAQGGKFFESGYIDTIENINDPEYIDTSDENSDSESECSGWAISIQKSAYRCVNIHTLTIHFYY